MRRPGESFTRIAVTLASTTIITVLISSSTRIIIPKIITPETFGSLFAAENLAAILTIPISFGVDNYIRSHPKEADNIAFESIRGILWIRILISISASALIATQNTKNDTYAAAIVILITYQTAILNSNTISAYIHSKRTTKEITKINISTKIIWASLSITSALSSIPSILIPLSFAGSEFIRLTLLSKSIKSILQRKPKLDIKRSINTIRISSSHFAISVCQLIYSKIDVQMISIMTNSKETGWYGAAYSISSIPMILIPAIQATLLPHWSTKNEDNKKSLSTILSKSIATTTLLATIATIFSDEIIQIAFSENYKPSKKSLIILINMTPLTYAASIISTFLISTGKTRHTTISSFIALPINITLNIIAINHTKSEANLGSAGFGASIASMLTEVIVLSSLCKKLTNEISDSATTMYFCATIVLANMLSSVSHITPNMAACLHLIAAILSSLIMVLNWKKNT